MFKLNAQCNSVKRYGLLEVISTLIAGIKDEERSPGCEDTCWNLGHRLLDLRTVRNFSSLQVTHSMALSYRGTNRPRLVLSIPLYTLQNLQLDSLLTSL
jgi:hypothetical protein